MCRFVFLLAICFLASAASIPPVSAVPSDLPRSLQQYGNRGKPIIQIRADRTSIGMGRTLVVTARVVDDRDRPMKGVEVWPYVNGRRWGAQATTDKQGKAILLLPLPNPGTARIQAAIPPPKPKPEAHWIWAATTSDGQTVFFRKLFTVPISAIRLRMDTSRRRDRDTVSGRVRRASLRITCDDVFEAYLNGQLIASGNNFQKVQHVTGLERSNSQSSRLKAGQNVLTVEGRNGVGPAGLLARLVIQTDQGEEAIATDDSWEVFTEKPAGWPVPVPKRGKAATVLAPVGEGVWGASLQGWPGLSPQNVFPVGQTMPDNIACSNTLPVQVRRRAIRMMRDPERLVGMEWEPWFTPLNVRWDTAEAAPIVGNYDSFNTDVIRQHCLWMVEAGINFILVDWTNNLWDKKHWSERNAGVNDLIRATTVTLDTYAQMRDEGIPVPQVTLLLGFDNGPTTTMAALNEEIQWVYENYIRNPRYRGLWLECESLPRSLQGNGNRGKPLIIPFNGGGPAARANQPAVDDSHFTIRWMSSQFQINHLEREGYWSWMDGCIHPIPTFYKGRAEALTVTPAFFADGGWTYPAARGRRGGSTYIEEFTTAFQYRPRYLIINQWNEFAGQPEGGGYGPSKDQFVDCYSAELSDDIEPTSLNVPAYRRKVEDPDSIGSGWGFYYLNLTRALVDLYHQTTPQTTLLAISHPNQGEAITSRSLKVEWTAIGKPARSFTLALDGRVVARDLHTTSHIIDLSGVPEGRHVITLTAEEAVTRFHLSYTQEDDALHTPIPAAATVEFFRKKMFRTNHTRE